MNLKERDRRIVLRVRDGETLRAVAQSYGICPERVRQIAKKHNVRSVRWIDKADFSHRDVATILDRLDRGMPHKHTAEVADCGASTVERIARRFRGYEPSREQRSWTAKEEAILRKRYKTKGWSAADIGERLGRTRDEVIGKANRIGLCKPPPNPTQTIHGRIRRALQRNPALPTHRLAEIGGCSARHASVARWQVRNEERLRNWRRSRHNERAAA